jgi:hypothetical protein
MGEKVFALVHSAEVQENKHKIPRSYSAAGESAASSTEARDDEPLVKAYKVRYRNKSHSLSG